MNFAKLRMLYSEGKRPVYKYRNDGGFQFQDAYVNWLEEKLLKFLNEEIRESGESICGLGVNPYCSDRAKDGTCLHDGFCKHKQTDLGQT
jgi:hypothetical protein